MNEWINSYLSTYRMHSLRSTVNRYNNKIAIHTREASNNQIRKQAIKSYKSRIAYLTKQRDSIINSYPEYFL